MQPEWFYKGNGGNVVACGQPIESPDFAEDHGEEPELVGCYLIDDHGRPHRLGFAIGNEFSDHVTERRNYLLLAHSKLRQCGVGPMLNTGTIPTHMEGTSRIRRDGEVLWQKPFLTGEGNMSHTFANLEYHHFKYRQHRIPGDVHLHFFGTATLSFVDNIRVQPGDEFEIDLPALGAPLTNPLAVEPGGHTLNGTSHVMNQDAPRVRHCGRSRDWPPAPLWLLQGTEGQSHRARLQPDRRRERVAHREYRIDQGRRSHHEHRPAVRRRTAEAGKPDQGAALVHCAEGRRHRLLAGGGNRLGHCPAGSQGRRNSR